MSMEARMSLSNLPQEYSFCACMRSLGQNRPLRQNTVFVVARIAACPQEFHINPVED